MTAVQAPAQGAEPLDLQMLAQRRPPRGPARGGGRFPIQLAEAAAGGPDRATGERERQRGASGPGGTDIGVTEPAPQAAMMGLPTVPPAPDPALPGTPLPSAGEPVEAGASASGEAVRTPAPTARSRPATTPEMQGRSNDQSQAPADVSGQAERSDPAAAPGLAAPVPAAERVHHAGPVTPVPDSAQDPNAPEAGAPRATAAAAAQPAQRREASAPSSPAPGGFRLEPAGRTAGPAPSARAERAPVFAPEPAQPADVLIGPGMGGLEVTIAAATPDLRDRFRAATGDLEAELSAIGAEVDAIRVELRGELADGGNGAGADARDGSRGDVGGDEPYGAAFGPAETFRGDPDAAARLELFEPGAGPAPDPERLEAEAGAAEDAGFSGLADAGNPDERGRDADARARDIERLRLLPGVASAGPAAARGAPDTFRAAPAGGPQRIDRYA